MPNPPQEDPRAFSSPGPCYLAKRGLSMGLRITIGLTLLLALVSAVAGMAAHHATSPGFTALITGCAGGCASLAVAWWLMHPFRQSIQTMEWAIKTLRDGDCSFRLAPPPQRELSRMINLFNDLGDQMRRARSIVYQKELLLDTVVQNAPMAILLIGPAQRILMANLEARQMFRLARPLTGMHVTDFLASAPPSLADAMNRGSDTLLSGLPTDNEDIIHLCFRQYQIHGQDHRLIMIKRLTREIRRKEAEAWKQAIRVINHELNNSLTPLSSLIHSARIILETPDHTSTIHSILQTMEQSTQTLIHFVQDYATFARLPAPRKQLMAWGKFLNPMKELFSFEIHMDAEPQGFFDPDQMQQVMVNILKNAWEAAPHANPPWIRVSAWPTGRSIVEITDWGQGMTEDAMSKAVLPFFSTKKEGTGLGLALSREIVEAHGGTFQLRRAPTGGLTVSCDLPGPQPDDHSPSPLQADQPRILISKVPEKSTLPADHASGFITRRTRSASSARSNGF